MLNRAYHRGITQCICKEAKYFATRAVWIDNAYCEDDLCNSIAHLVKHTLEIAFNNLLTNNAYFLKLKVSERKENERFFHKKMNIKLLLFKS